MISFGSVKSSRRSSLSGSSTKRLRASAASDLLAHERILLRDDLPHLRLERREILGRERRRDLEVVVEAVVDRRTEADLRVGAQPSHRRREHVRRRMPQHAERLGIALGEHAERAALPQRRHEILDLAVHRHGDGGAEQALADRPHDVGGKRAGGHAARGAVGQHEGELGVEDRERRDDRSCMTSEWNGRGESAQQRREQVRVLEVRARRPTTIARPTTTQRMIFRYETADSVSVISVSDRNWRVGRMCGPFCWGRRAAFFLHRFAKLSFVSYPCGRPFATGFRYVISAFRGRRRSSTAGTVTSVLLGAVAGFAVGMFVAQRVGGFSGLADKVRRRSRPAEDEAEASAPAVADDFSEYDEDDDDELEDEGVPNEGLEERVLEAFRNDPILCRARHRHRRHRRGDDRAGGLGEHRGGGGARGRASRAAFPASRPSSTASPSATRRSGSATTRAASRRATTRSPRRAGKAARSAPAVAARARSDEPDRHADPARRARGALDQRRSARCGTPPTTRRASPSGAPRPREPPRATAPAARRSSPTGVPKADHVADPNARRLTAEPGGRSAASDASTDMTRGLTSAGHVHFRAARARPRARDCLSAQYDPAATEPEIYERWHRGGLLHRRCGALERARAAIASRTRSSCRRRTSRRSCTSGTG